MAHPGKVDMGLGGRNRTVIPEALVAASSPRPFPSSRCPGPEAGFPGHT
jgi:hypothetical protein